MLWRSKPLSASAASIRYLIHKPPEGMKKPSWFKVLDLVFFCIPIVGLSLATIYAMVTGVEGPHAVQAVALCWVVVAAFLGIYLRLLWMRWTTLKQYRWYPTYGFMLRQDGYQLPEEGILDGSVWKTIQVWSKHHPNAEQIVKSAVNWVSFHKDLNENDKNRARAKVKGFTVAVSHTMAIDYDSPDEPLDRTAFEHELGHIIHGFATQNWDMEQHHEFMKKHGLR